MNTDIKEGNEGNLCCCFTLIVVLYLYYRKTNVTLVVALKQSPVSLFGKFNYSTRFLTKPTKISCEDHSMAMK